jgi:hypothetical protein
MDMSSVRSRHRTPGPFRRSHRLRAAGLQGRIVRTPHFGAPVLLRKEPHMNSTKETRDKALVLEAFDTLFNERD